MALVGRAIVDDVKFQGREGGGQFRSNCVGHAHNNASP